MERLKKDASVKFVVSSAFHMCVLCVYIVHTTAQQELICSNVSVKS